VSGVRLVGEVMRDLCVISSGDETAKMGKLFEMSGPGKGAALLGLA